jgi:Trypsin-co-occurring domain 2
VKVTGSGVPIGTLIIAVKKAVKQSGISQSSAPQDLQVASVRLVLRTLASKTAGGSLDFRIPFIGMKIRAGATVTTSDTQTVTITLVPPAKPGRAVRGDVEQTLVDAITTIRQTMAEGAAGDDPWVLSDSVIDIDFGITRTGSISIGSDGELSGEVTQSLSLTLKSPSRP